MANFTITSTIDWEINIYDHNIDFVVEPLTSLHSLMCLNVSSARVNHFNITHLTFERCIFHMFWDDFYESTIYHTPHIWTVSLLCIISCDLRYVLRVNRLSHTSHLKGLSPVCILICTVKLFICVNALSQISHLYGFSPVWIIMCVFNWCRLVNHLLQIWHMFLASSLLGAKNRSTCLTVCP